VCALVFIAPPLSFGFVFVSVFLLLWGSSLPYPNLLGTKSLGFFSEPVVVVACKYVVLLKQL
jgi:hypothetical protein